MILEKLNLQSPDLLIENLERLTANLPTTKTLRPVREESVDFDKTENLYIEGDNLEVLKLLRETEMKVNGATHQY